MSLLASVVSLRARFALVCDTFAAMLSINAILPNIAIYFNRFFFSQKT